MNEVEKKEIEEIKKFACIVCEMGRYEEYESGKINYGCIERTGECNCGIGESLAKALYNAGYRKVIDRDITKALNYEIESLQVEDYKKEIERLKELNDNLKSEKEGYKSRLKDSGNRNKKLSLKLGKLKKEKQQAIKKFAEEIKDKFFEQTVDIKRYDYDFRDTIDDLLKEYGGGETNANKYV